MTWWRKLDTWLDTCVWVLLVLLLLLALRIPNFFEPYWYGDEGIYLTIGIALRYGQQLYVSIVDHKTPLIYFLAMVSSQLWFRVLLTGWMLVTTMAFYQVLGRLVTHAWSRALALLLFVLLTTLPWFEGNIPNGELFVMGFVIVALRFLLQSDWGQLLDQEKRPPTTLSLKAWPQLLLVGALLGLGILTKVPALFDAVAVLAIGWWSGSSQVLTATAQSLLGYFKTPNLKTQKQTLFSAVSGEFLKQLRLIGPSLMIVLAGLMGTILLSILYFVVRGAGKEYLEFGLLYNIRYASSWQLTFTSPLTQWLFSFGGKLTLLVLSLSTLTLGYSFFTRRFQFVLGWTVLSLFASLLSNRPYPHYFLQVIPPLCLVLGLWWDDLIALWPTAAVPKPMRSLDQSKATLAPKLRIIFSTAVAGVFLAVLALLRVGFYPTWSYYSNLFSYLKGDLTRTQYYQSFNTAMADNYQAAQLIAQSNSPYLFIWGTNPMLYALTHKIPPGRFTVAFHVREWQAQAETLAAVQKTAPPYIVVMNNEGDTYPEFYTYLVTHYMPNQNFKTFTLWKRLPTPNTAPSSAPGVVPSI